MANQVRVTSLDALESFRADLIIFLTKARRSVDDAADGVRRMRQWIQHDQRARWEGELRRRKKVLEQAEQELFSAKLSALRDSTTVQQAAVRKAKHALDEAEEKMRRVKLWTRDFDSCADPLVKKLLTLRQFLDHEMPKGVAYLVQALRTLEAYAETSAPPADAPATPAVEESVAPPADETPSA